jgi:hypothetical protein
VPHCNWPKCAYARHLLLFVTNFLFFAFPIGTFELITERLVDYEANDVGHPDPIGHFIARYDKSGRSAIQLDDSAPPPPLTSSRSEKKRMQTEILIFVSARLLRDRVRLRPYPNLRLLGNQKNKCNRSYFRSK